MRAEAKAMQVAFGLGVLGLLVSLSSGSNPDAPGQTKMLWLDNETGSYRMETREKLARLLDQCVAAGVNTVAVDIKNWFGLGFYRSEILPRPGLWLGQEYPADYDLLQVALEEGHKRNLRVHAALNVFSEGAKRERLGPVWDHPDWEAVAVRRQYFLTDGTGLNVPVQWLGEASAEGLFFADARYGRLLARQDSAACAIDGNTITSSSLERGAALIVEASGNRIARFVQEEAIPDCGLPLGDNCLFLLARGSQAEGVLRGLQIGQRAYLDLREVLLPESQVPGGLLVYVDPNHPEVRQRMLDVLREVVSRYAVDGIILDRARYDNFAVDFSGRSRRSFEASLGRRVTEWPGSIARWPDPVTGGSVERGPLFLQWVQWRAKVIRDFIFEARQVVKSVRPEAEFGDYVGGWYPDYWPVGVNWASSEYDPSQEYDWASPDYKQTGYAERLDYLSPGLYYSDITVEEARANGRAEHLSVEGGLALAKRVTRGSTRLVAGLYYPNLHQPDRFRRAVQMALREADGVMIFSHAHFDSPERWSVLRDALAAEVPMEQRPWLDEL